MRKFPTMEELSGMSLVRLRSLDIMNGDEEAMVQTVINSKHDEERVERVNIRVPDIHNGEEEAYWQKKVDEAREAQRPKRVSMADISPSGEASIPEVVEVKEEVKEETPKKFCEFCDAKGPISHKKNCTRIK